MATSIKISQLPAKGANLEATDLLEVSEFNGTGYVSKSITGQEIIDSASGGSGVTDVTATAPVLSTGGTTPDISMAVADAGHDGYLSSTDWNTFDAKVDSVTATYPMFSTGGANPDLSMYEADGTVPGYISTADYVYFANKQQALVSGTNIKTINGSSLLGSGNLVVSSNPSVIVLNATDGTAVTGTLTETISRSLLIPANTFTSEGMLEVVARVFKTGTLAGQTFRIYKNTSNTLTGATLIGLVLSASTQLYAQAIRTYRINSNTLTGFPTSTAASVDYAQNGNVELSTTFTTSVDNYILFAIQLSSTGDSSTIRMARATKYI